MKKIVMTVLVLFIVSIVCTNVIATTDPVLTDPGWNPGLVDNKIEKTTQNIWQTVVVLVQIASVACIVFAGLRYMFASADQRADIKQGLIYLGIGSVLVFGATLIIDLVAKAGENIM